MACNSIEHLVVNNALGKRTHQRATNVFGIVSIRGDVTKIADRQFANEFTLEQPSFIFKPPDIRALENATCLIKYPSILNGHVYRILNPSLVRKRFHY